MRKPTLDSEASQFYDRHAKRCKADGTLTPQTFDSFVLLCRTYSLLVRTDPDADPKTGVIKWIGLTRLFQQLGRAFGVNTDKPKPPKKDDDLDNFLSRLNSNA